MLYGMHEIECILALWLKGSHFRFWRMYYGLPSQLYLQLVIRLYIRIQATVTGFNYLLPSTGDSISASKSDLSSILADSGFNGRFLAIIALVCRYISFKNIIWAYILSPSAHWLFLRIIFAFLLMTYVAQFVLSALSLSIKFATLLILKCVMKLCTPSH